MFVESYFVTKKFLRRLGEDIFDKLENENIYKLCQDHLKMKNLEDLPQEIIEDLLTSVAQEDTSKQNGGLIDEFTAIEACKYLEKKTRQSPDQIFRENLKQIERYQSLQDDEDIIEGSFNSFIQLEEDDLVEKFEKTSIDDTDYFGRCYNIERLTAQLGTNPVLPRRDQVESIINEDISFRAHYENVYGHTAGYDITQYTNR